MFDQITNVPEVICFNCKEPLKGWQSKDGACTLENVPYWNVDHFYTACKCGLWYDYKFKVDSVRPIENYELTVDPKRSNLNANPT